MHRALFSVAPRRLAQRSAFVHRSPLMPALVRAMHKTAPTDQDSDATQEQPKHRSRLVSVARFLYNYRGVIIGGGIGLYLAENYEMKFGFDFHKMTEEEYAAKKEERKKKWVKDN
ncbi:hypothetical protein BJ508DRAFT_377428 [Ascobolus immersus RN42]|uniref:Uncharacterized protein n=1 Tax=Ascobolus immersus RN42 TaxID=1160509 RepID=A0A3N4I1M5_ASCIM|nr:hypothetical protein BJ508DRAFT_377428 [Ascobolus immersus RN42]